MNTSSENMNAKKPTDASITAQIIAPKYAAPARYLSTSISRVGAARCAGQKNNVEKCNDFAKRLKESGMAKYALNSA